MNGNEGAVKLRHRIYTAPKNEQKFPKNKHQGLQKMTFKDEHQGPPKMNPADTLKNCSKTHFKVLKHVVSQMQGF